MTKGTIPISIINLGCPKNLVDAENLYTYLAARGFHLESDPLRSRVLLVNTCCFIDDARDESVEKIIHAVRLKQSNPGLVVIVTGCMPVKYRNDLEKEIPEVDRFIDGALPHDVYSFLAHRFGTGRQDQTRFEGPETSPGRLWLETPHYAYLKIAEGCDYRCSFCVIPEIRGPYRSVPIPDLVSEARSLVSRNVRELIVVAQHTTSYGKDLRPRVRLINLLRELENIEGNFWIRLLYGYPTEFDNELLRYIAGSQKVCHYLDIPVQHSHPDILENMHRKETALVLDSLFQNIRSVIPDVALRTSVLVGFPGETEDQFLHLVRFLRETGFMHVGCFLFSPQPGTPAATMKKQVPLKTGEQRVAAIIETQQKILQETQANLIGTAQKVLVEEYLGEGHYCYSGRTFFQAPEIDGQVYVHGKSLQCGSFYTVKIEDYDMYDLFGSIIENE